MSKIRTGDQVQVIAGKDKGLVGEVISIVGDRVVVEGANRATKHQRATQAGQSAGIITVEAPVHISNVQLLVDNDGSKTTTRLGSAVVDGKKTRISRKTGKEA